MQSPFSLVGIVLAGVLAMSPALAQALFKSTMPDGKVIYGDKPVPGASKVEETKPPATKGVAPPSAKEGAALRRMESERAHDDAAKNRVIGAEKALADAEARLASGKEPLPGERIGTAGGASRLTESYFERVKALEQDVQNARTNLNNARTGR